MDKETIFHLLDLMILNSFILLTPCGTKLSHRDFRLALVRNLIQEGGRVIQCQTNPQVGQTPSTSHLEVHGSKH